MGHVACFSSDYRVNSVYSTCLIPCFVSLPYCLSTLNLDTLFVPPPQEDQTPLHIASRLGKTDIVQLLLQHMAHPDAATTNGYTPLHISAREGQVETAAVLLEAGASHSLATKVSRGQSMTHIDREIPNSHHNKPKFLYRLINIQLKMNSWDMQV